MYRVAIVWKMDKKEIKAVIKYHHIKGMNIKEIHDDMVKHFVRILLVIPL